MKLDEKIDKVLTEVEMQEKIERYQSSFLYTLQDICGDFLKDRATVGFEPEEFTSIIEAVADLYRHADNNRKLIK